MPDQGAAHPAPGLALPSIELAGTDGNMVDLSAVPGRSLVMVYPWTGRPGHPNPPDWDDIPGAHGSTPELEGFRDRHVEFARLGVTLFGLSRQTIAYQQELVERLALPFAILSDSGGHFGGALRLPVFVTGGVTYLARLTLLIDRGRIVRVFYPVADPAAHAADVLATLVTGYSDSSSASSTE